MPTEPSHLMQQEPDVLAVPDEGASYRSFDPPENSRPYLIAWKHSYAWKWPWFLVLISLGLFTVPWMYAAIFIRYLVEHDFDTLAGLDTTMSRRVFLVSHMLAGSVALLLGPTQFYAPLRQMYPRIHRWSGRLYVVATCTASICGLIFCCLKGFILSGGLNMGLAFAAAGIAFGSFGFMVYYTAAIQKNWERHRAYAVRSYCQVLAPMLYRYWYTVLIALRLYNPSKYTNSGCNEDTGLCEMFLQTFDKIHCWTYWLTSLVVGELIVRALPAMDGNIMNHDFVISSTPNLADSNVSDENVSRLDITNIEAAELSGNEVVAEDTESLISSARNEDVNHFRDLNFVGVAIAGVTLSVTATIFLFSS